MAFSPCSWGKMFPVDAPLSKITPSTYPTSMSNLSKSHSKIEIEIEIDPKPKPNNVTRPRKTGCLPARDQLRRVGLPAYRKTHRFAPPCRDQWLRASQSIPLNIAEGNGKSTAADRRRFFEIARVTQHLNAPRFKMSCSSATHWKKKNTRPASAKLTAWQSC